MDVFTVDRGFPIFLSLGGTVLGASFACFFSHNLTKTKSGLLVASAAGMMIGCSLVLIAESAQRTSVPQSILSVFVGIALMAGVDRLCSDFLNETAFHFSGVSSKQSVRVLVMLLGLVVHSVGEGLSLGLSAADSFSSTGSIVASSLAVHNVPETAALLISFRAKGLSETVSVLFAIFSNLPQSLVAIPALRFFSSNAEIIKYGMGVSSGCMLYAVVEDIFPEAEKLLGRRSAVGHSLLGAVVIIVFDIYSHIQIR